MNLQQLKYVVEVDRAQSISKAAEKLYMGQPNLSKAIKDFEKELGITLFKRTSKGVVPTASGVEFLNYANAILGQIHELEHLYHSDDKEKFQMRLAVPRASYVTAAFSSFVNHYTEEQEIDVSFKELSPLATIQDVASGESHVGIVRYQNNQEHYISQILSEHNLSYENFYEFDMVLLMHMNHPLSALREIPYHLLDQYIEIVHGDYQIPALAYHKINKDGVVAKPRKHIYVYDRASQFDLLRSVEGSYMWVSPVPFELATRHELVQKPCNASGKCNDIIIYQDKSSMNKYEKHFIRELRETIKNNQGII